MPASTALVTGAASGIGAALVVSLERAGVAVDALDVRDGFDVSDARAWERVGPVAQCYLNAGVTGSAVELAELSEHDYRRVVSVNVDGVVFGARRMAQVMAPGGVIVATASLAGLAPLAADPLYTLTKHAVVGFVRAVAPQLERRGIRICAVAPGFADTPLLDGLRAELESARFPLLSPDEVAGAAIAAAASAGAGEVWIVQPGRAPVPMRFPNLPGPRDAEGRGVGPPPGS